MTSLEQKIWVLFASQTGNSEQAARKIAALLPDQCRSTSSNTDITHVCEVMPLDDFLELERAAWTPIVILCVSSYGVGQAPLGGYRFREFCDYLVETAQTQSSTTLTTSTTTTTPVRLLLQGLQFALLGLGDSKYTTFFENPTQTNLALELAGATRIGAIGKADASSKKDQPHKSQEQLIDDWIDHLWKPLQDALLRTHDMVSPERLEQMQHDTCAICAQINPDFQPSQSQPSLFQRNASMTTRAEAFRNSTPLRTCLAMAVIAIVWAWVLQPLVFK